MNGEVDMIGRLRRKLHLLARTLFVAILMRFAVRSPQEWPPMLRTLAYAASGSLVLAAAVSSPAQTQTSYQYAAQWGRPAPGGFFGPQSIAVDAAGNIYVTDTYNNRIQKFAADTTFLMQWGGYGAGNGQFVSPAAIAIDANGNIFVADWGNCRIVKFTSSGAYVTQWGSQGNGNGQFDVLKTYLAVDPSGNVYVADQGNDRIQKFTNSGAYITKWGTHGSGNGQFNSPAGIAADASGNLYVADSGNDRVQRFNSAGVYLGMWGSSGTGDGQFDCPAAIALDSAGNVYVVDGGCSIYGHGRVQKFSSTGGYLTQWDGYNGTINSQFILPEALAIDGSANVYVLEAAYTNGDPHVRKFTSAGGFLVRWGHKSDGPGDLSEPGDVAVDGSGNVYVTDTNNYRVQKFSSSGAYLTESPSDYTSQCILGGSPGAVTLDPAGNVYVTDWTRILRLGADLTCFGPWANSGGYYQGGIAADRDGNVFVVDQTAYPPRIQKYANDGALLTSWSTPTNFTGGLVVDQSGDVLIGEAWHIEKYSGTGIHLDEWTIPAGTRGPTYVSGLALDAAGNVYVSDFDNDRIVKLSGSGSFVCEWGGSGNNDGQFEDPLGVALDAAGNVYVADRYNNRIQKFRPLPAFTVTTTSFDRSQYSGGDVATLTVTLSSIEANATGQVTATLKPRFGPPVTLNTKPATLTPGAQTTVTWTWAVPNVTGQTLLDVSVSADAGVYGRATQDVAHVAVLNELTTAAIQQAQQQLRDCGTTTEEACLVAPGELLDGMIPFVGTALGVQATVGDGCLATHAWQQGRHIESAVMWLATASDALDVTLSAIGDYACVASAGTACVPAKAVDALVELAPGAVSGAASCFVTLLDEPPTIPYRQGVTRAVRLLATDSLMAWLPDSLRAAFTEAGDTLADLAVCSGPARLRVEADSCFTTADSVGNQGVVVLRVGSHPIQCAAVRVHAARLFGARNNPTSANTLRWIANAADTCRFVLFHRRSPGTILKLEYAPFFLGAGGCASISVAEDSTQFMLGTDVDGDGIADRWLAPGPGSTSVEPDPVLRPQLSLGMPRPNPFTAMTTIPFELPGAGRTRLEVFDLSGRRIATLVDGELPAGKHVATWSVHDASFSEVAGVFFARLVTPMGSRTRPIIRFR